MTLDLVFLVLGLVLLVFGAEGLVRGSSSLALRLGLSPLVVGLTVVAFGTSAPELVVSVGASLQGAGDIAIGNVIGSNIINIGVILGLTALICPIAVTLSVLKTDGPLMVVVTGGVALLIGSGPITSAMGGVMVVGLIAYTGFTVWLARRHPSEDLAHTFEAGVPAQSTSLARDVAFLLGGLGLLVAGSQLLVDSATDLARLFGVSEAVIGLTIIATGTSLPELATSLVAALRGQPDIAVGNIVGSNLFNLLGILGVAALVRPLSAPGIEGLDLGAMVVLSLALLPLLSTGRALLRWEGSLLLLLYALYLWMRWP